LAYDYQIERDPDDPPNVDEIFACRCGAAKCRGSMLVARKETRKKKTAKVSKSSQRGKKSVSKSVKKSTKTAKKKSAKSGKRAGKKAINFDIAPAMARRATARDGGRNKRRGAAR
jgi:hypothetical protein